MAQILIVDDDSRLRQSFAKLLLGEGHEVVTASTGEEGVDIVGRGEGLSLAIVDVRLPGMSGLEAFRAMRGLDPDLPVIVMTAFGTTDTAIEATKAGAFDYILKPFDIPEVLALIAKALESRRPAGLGEHALRDEEGEHSTLLVGRSQAMQNLYKSIGRVAATEATVLVRGESGTGKELVAGAIHRHSLRADRPYQVINCVAIPETLLESELFGYEKGAFTGATARRVGKIELAHRGTLFLDEIGDMPLAIQAKLLRLLQERQIERLGGGKPIGVDVRIIAATNRDLEKAIQDGAFREDLYYRLKVVTLWVPPLRERPEDIPLLAQHFLSRHACELDSPVPTLEPAALERLMGYPWPGNIRELSNTLHKTLIFTRGGSIAVEDVATALSDGRSRGPGTEEAAGRASEAIRGWVRQELVERPGGRAYEALCERFDCLLVSEALAMAGGNRSKAARMLGITRPTLLARIEKYGLKTETTVTE